MKMKRFPEVFLFARVIAISLLVIGYILMGFFISRRLVEHGYPEWLQIALPVAGALIGLHQAYRFLREIIRNFDKHTT